MYIRPLSLSLAKRFSEPRRFIQMLAGPRQVGKTTLARQLTESLSIPYHSVSADEPTLRDHSWLAQQWDIARVKTRSSGRKAAALLIIDEIQKVPDWAEGVKRLWDEDSKNKTKLYVFLLGSAPLLIQRGLSESLTGRFEIIYAPHWSFPEMRDAFGWNVNQYVYYGGYPGAAALIRDPNRWMQYIRDSLIETTISRDVFLLTRVDKPALLRRLFHIACEYSGRIVSYQKMLGQLHDAGNTTTLANYLELLSGAGMVAGLQKYAGEKIRQRGSSPKLQVLNTALMSVHSGLSLKEARNDREYWGRLTESAVGAHILNSVKGTAYEVFYWRDRNREVDFVLQSGKKLVALEVKSGKAIVALPGISEFGSLFKLYRSLLVGAQGMAIEEFLSTDIANYFV